MERTDGPAFYDQEAVFKQYLQHRAKPDNPNQVIETPIIEELIGDPRGLNCLDIGCGYGDMARYLLEGGISSYLGIDPSSNMIEMAREKLAHPAIHFALGQAEAMEWEPGQFDLVIARLVFHYVKDISMSFQQIYKGLRPGGTFIFSVEHPVMTAWMDKASAGSKKEGWKVGAYFKSGPRNHEWMGSRVTKYHKTIEEYFSILRLCGFEVLALREGCPNVQHFSSTSEYERRRELPRYLILKAKK